MTPHKYMVDHLSYVKLAELLEKTGHKALCHALGRGYYEIAKYLIGLGVKLNPEGNEFNGDLSVSKILGKLNYKLVFCACPLTIVILSRNMCHEKSPTSDEILDMIKLLLENGANPNLSSPTKGNILSASIVSGNYDIFKLLLDHNALLDIDTYPLINTTILHAKHLVLKYLIEHYPKDKLFSEINSDPMLLSYMKQYDRHALEMLIMNGIIIEEPI